MIKYVAGLALVLTVSGCLEIKTRTTVSEDGSSERIVTLRRPTRSLPNAAYPIPRDSSWTVEWNELPQGEKQVQYEYVARKRFATPADLEKEYAAIPDTGVLTVRVHLAKRFRWFYTYFDFKETYSLRSEFRQIPISAVLTPEEIAHYQYSYTGSIQDSILDAKIRAWNDRNQWDDFFQGLVRIVENRNIPDVTVLKLMRTKERFLALVEVWGKEKGKKSGKDDPGAFFAAILEEVLETKSVRSLKPDLDALWEDWLGKHDRMGTANGTYENSVQLPGILLETNSNRVQGNLVAWKVKTEQLGVGEFVMTAQSRVANTWAFVATGLGGVAVMVLGMVRIFRRST
jgi:hypothetical protein